MPRFKVKDVDPELVQPYQCLTQPSEQAPTTPLSLPTSLENGSHRAVIKGKSKCQEQQVRWLGLFHLHCGQPVSEFGRV